MISQFCWFKKNGKSLVIFGFIRYLARKHQRIHKLNPRETNMHRSAFCFLLPTAESTNSFVKLWRNPIMLFLPSQQTKSHLWKVEIVKRFQISRHAQKLIRLVNVYTSYDFLFCLFLCVYLGGSHRRMMMNFCLFSTVPHSHRIQHSKLPFS